LVSVTVWEFVVPVVTLPNAIDAGEAVSVDCAPVPLNAIVSGEFGALLTTEMLPVALPEPVGANCAVKLADCPAAIVSGVVAPEMLNPAPVTFTDETVTLAEPLFFKVIVCELLLPTFTLPKFSLAGEAPSCAWVPVPLSAIVSGAPGPLFAIEIEPVALPAVVGANCAVNDVLCPAFNVAGVLKPVMLNPVPVVVAELTVTLAEPELVSVIVCVPLLPVATDPKFTLPGFDVSWPCTPVPESDTVAGDPAALLAIEIDPVALPAAAGVNVVLNEALPPAVTVIGKLPLTLKPLPAAVADVIVSVALPEFVSDTVCVPVLPTLTLPKLTLGVPSVNCAWPVVPVPLNAINIGEFGALLATEIEPVAAPDAVGANFTPNVALCPAASVCGVTMPLMLKADPETVAEERFTLAVPPFVSVTFTVLLLPVSWLPKFTLPGFAVKLPSVPVPVVGIVTVESVAVLVTVIVPDAEPAVVGENCAVNDVLCPAAIVSGVVNPVTLKPAPVAEIWLTVVLALPELVKVTVCWPLLETATLPKATLPGFAVNVEDCEIALPVSVTTCGEPGALSVKVMLPVAAPAVVGENVTPNESVWPAVIVFGSESPLIPNALPESVARLIVTLEVPVFVSVTFCVLLWFTCTFENVSVEGEIESPACVAVPFKETIRGEFDASLITVSAPEAAPAVVGANCTVTVMLWPTARLVAGLPPVTLNPAPVTVACEMFTAAVPAFVTVTFCVALPPTATLPNVTLVEFAESTPLPGFDGLVLAELV
jgi:hypothetical protein